MPLEVVSVEGTMALEVGSLGGGDDATGGR